MHLTLSPIRGLPGQAETILSVSGDVLTIDGVAVDFAELVPAGGEFHPDPGDHPFIGSIIRVNSDIHATVRVVLGDDAEPHQPTDPEHWIVAVTEGPVAIPALRRPEPEPEPEPEIDGEAE